MNAQKAQLLAFQLSLENAKYNINQLLSNPLDQDFVVTDSILVNYNPSFEDLKKTVISKNNQLQTSPLTGRIWMLMPFSH